MKFNWGTGIFLFYGLFATALFYQVYRSTTYDHSLVTPQYYKEDLAYQQHYEKLVNSQALKNDLMIGLDRINREVLLEFPPEVGPAKGEILFFCPSDSKRDFRLEVAPGEDYRQLIPVDQLKPGLWKVKVDWQASGMNYFKEKALIL